MTRAADRPGRTGAPPHERHARPTVVRVLVVTNSVDPHYGGPIMVAANSAIALAAQGVAITYAAPADARTAADGNEVTQLLEAAGVAVRLFPITRLPAGIGARWGVSIAFLGWLRHHARTFDAVILHSPWAAATVFVAAMTRGAHPPVLLCPHESWTRFDMHRTGGRAKRRFKDMVGRLLLSRLDAVIFSSGLEREDCYFAVDDARARVIHHPVSSDDHIPPAPRRTDPERLTFGYLGRFHPKKNVDLVIRAVAGLPENATLRIAGSGELEPALRSLATELGVDHRVSWCGFMGLADKPAFFAACDALVMPSTYECFGMSHAEAICHGVPVLTTPKTGVSAVIAAYGCGTLVEPTEAAVREGMMRYVAEPSALDAAKSHCALVTVAEFGFAAHGRKIADLLGNLLF